MNTQDVVSSSQPRNRTGWRRLSLRWFFGWFTGFGLSSWICFSYITNTVSGPLLWAMDFLPIVIYLFGGPLLLFDPEFFGNKTIIESLVRYFPNIDYHLLVIALPSMIWGLIGALIASGRKNQIRVGVVLLLFYISLGCIALFQVLIHMPT